MIHITWKNREATELQDKKYGRNEGCVAGPVRTDWGAAGGHSGQLAQPEGWCEGNTWPWQEGEPRDGRSSRRSASRFLSKQEQLCLQMHPCLGRI